MVCGLQAEGDLFLGGAACKDTIDLPTNRDELASFLSGPSATLLWNYTVASPFPCQIFVHKVWSVSEKVKSTNGTLCV